MSSSVKHDGGSVVAWAHILLLLVTFSLIFHLPMMELMIVAAEGRNSEDYRNILSAILLKACKRSATKYEVLFIFFQFQTFCSDTFAQLKIVID